MVKRVKQGGKKGKKKNRFILKDKHCWHFGITYKFQIFFLDILNVMVRMSFSSMMHIIYPRQCLALCSCSGNESVIIIITGYLIFVFWPFYGTSAIIFPFD